MEPESVQPSWHYVRRYFRYGSVFDLPLGLENRRRYPRRDHGFNSIPGCLVSIPRPCALLEAFLGMSKKKKATKAKTVRGVRSLPAKTLPPTSSINYSANQTRANNAVILLSASGDFSVQCGQASGSAHAIIDVNGYFE
jgi:hypothetical protein